MIRKSPEVEETEGHRSSFNYLRMSEDSSAFQNHHGRTKLIEVKTPSGIYQLVGNSHRNHINLLLLLIIYSQLCQLLIILFTRLLRSVQKLLPSAHDSVTFLYIP